MHEREGSQPHAESIVRLTTFGDRGARQRVAAVASLTVLVAVVFSQVSGHGFLNYDDDLYVTANTHVRDGLSAQGVVWAFTTTHAANWHPLTWLSHMLDVTLFGMNPGYHHVMNVVFHGANAVLLFFVLLGLTGRLRRSVAVAALFAIHPLHVESVAWLSERKDLLCGLLCLLCLLAYTRYARNPRAARYALVVTLFALALLAKPMAVTLPFVLLLLDFWPLGRWGGAGPGKLRLFTEKVPLLLLSGSSGVVTYLTQLNYGTVRNLVQIPLVTRLGNAIVAYATYAATCFWPLGLSVTYPPLERGASVWRLVSAAVAVAAMTLVVLISARRKPYGATGWLWFLGTLVPVIGIIPVAAQFVADRYTYLPLIGLFLLLVWSLADMVQDRPRFRAAAVAGGWLVLLVLSVISWRQVGLWRDSVALFTHAVNLEPENAVAARQLGVALIEQGKTAEGSAYLTRALQLDPESRAELHYRAGTEHTLQGRYREALEEYREALRLLPPHMTVQRNLVLHNIAQVEPFERQYKK